MCMGFKQKFLREYDRIIITFCHIWHSGVVPHVTNPAMGDIVEVKTITESAQSFINLKSLYVYE